MSFTLLCVSSPCVNYKRQHYRQSASQGSTNQERAIEKCDLLEHMDLLIHQVDHSSRCSGTEVRSRILADHKIPSTNLAMSRDAHATAGNTTLPYAFRTTISLRITFAVDLCLSGGFSVHHVRKCLTKQQAGSAIEYDVLEMHVGLQRFLKDADKLSTMTRPLRPIYMQC